MNPYHFLTAILCLFLAACGSMGNKGRTIDLTVEGGNGQTAYFEKFESNRPVKVDSVKLDAEGKGSMDIPRMPLDFYRITLGQEQLVLALDSTENAQIVTKAGALNVPTTLTGSTHSEALHEFYRTVDAYQKEVGELRQTIAAQPENAEAVTRLNELNASHYDGLKKFTKAHSSSPAAISSVSMLDVRKELPLFKQVRDDLRKVMPRSGTFTMFRDQVAQVEAQETQLKMQEEAQKRKDNMLPIGSMAPEIRQQTPDGGTFALSDLKGQYVLIDFWASWCRPCRYENPNVKRIYDRFHKKGFEILGVSLDKDLASWQKAIKDDGLPWKHVSDLGYWNNAAAQEYGANSIPYTVLVDREGKILAKGMRANELEPKLAELFGK